MKALLALLLQNGWGFLLMLFEILGDLCSEIMPLFYESEITL